MFSFSALISNEVPVYFCALLLVTVLPTALMRAPWRLIFSNTGLQHLFAGSVVLLLLLWSIKGQLATGFEIHLLGVTALTLILGWDLAIIAALTTLTTLTLYHGITWQNFAINGVLTVLLPVAVTQLVFVVVERNLAKNFFVYLFVCGFFCAALNAALLGGVLSGVLWLVTPVDWLAIQRDVITVIPLTLFPEGLLNGVLLTAAMVFYPDWIRCFDAKGYIDEQ